MEKKIANMTAAEVAAMRQAQKEAEAAYFNAKVNALESMAVITPSLSVFTYTISFISSINLPS